MNAVWSIALKDLRILLRDRSALVFLFGLPLVFTGIFGAVYSGRGNSSSSPIRILVLNQDRGAHGAELVDSMQKLGITIENETAGSEHLKQRVQNGEQAIGVVIPPNYSERLEAAVHAESGTPGEQARLTRYSDPAQQQIAEMANGAIRGAVQRSVGIVYRKAALEQAPAEFREQAERNATLAASAQPVVIDAIETQRRPKTTTGDLIIPGFAVYFVFTLANGVASTLLYERQEGTLRRMLSAPISRNQILLGKMLARGMVGLVQTVVLFVIGKFSLSLTLGWAEIPPVLLIAVVTVFASTGLGLMISTFGKTMEQIQGMTTMALLVMGFISGTLIPRNFLPASIQRLSYITPHAWALNAYQDVLLRHHSLLGTLANLLVVMAFAGAFYLFALNRFKFEI